MSCGITLGEKLPEVIIGPFDADAFAEHGRRTFQYCFGCEPDYCATTRAAFVQLQAASGLSH